MTTPSEEPSLSEPASEAVCNDEAVSGSAAAGSSMPRKVVGWDGEERMAIANKWPKRKVAVIFGYCGTGYMGSQLNPGVKTIDGELVLALGKSGFVLESNLEPLTKIQYSRTARTDKGVHAAANVVSFFIMTPPGVDNEAARVTLNALLPPDIRIHGIIKTTNHFNAKVACSGRQYEYLLPTFVFNPDDAGELREGVVEEVEEGPADDEDDFGPRVSPSSVALAAGAPSGPSVSSPVPATGPDDYQTGAAQARGRAEAAARLAAHTKRAARFGYRVPPETIAAFREVGRKFLGTNSHHNFSPSVTPSEPSAQRFITGFDVSPAFVIDDAELVKITIRGQAFLLNQIRHMIGAAVATVKQGLPPTFIERLFNKTEETLLPLAPATGLFLHSAFFKGYNEKHGADHEPLTFTEGDVADRIRDFKEVKIWKHVVSQIAVSGVFEHWLASQLRNFSFKFRPYVLTEAEKLRKKRAKEEKQAYIAKRGKKG